MKLLTTAICILVLLVLINKPAISQGYRDPDLVAHYKLDTITLGPNKVRKDYDVSGNGGHGNFISPSSFAIKTFFGKTKCIEKLQYDVDGVFAIPEPLVGHELESEFTVMFWAYFNPALALENKFVEFSTVSIKQKGVDLTVEHLELNGIVADVTTKEFDDVFMGGEGWYFLALTYKSTSASTGEYYFHTLKVDENFNVEANFDLPTKVASGSAIVIAADKKSQLFDRLCKARMRDVKFFKKKLTVDAIKTEIKKDILWSRWKIGDPVPEGIYVEENSFAHYPLNANEQAGFKTEVSRDRHGSAISGVTALPDRFANSGGAAAFATNGHISLPKFFENYDSREGFTISFWTHIDQVQNAPGGDVVGPYLSEDPQHQIYYGKDNGNQNVFGMQKIRDRVILNRYIGHVRPYKPWSLWLWDQAAFRPNSANETGTGWYHVIISQRFNATRVYMFKPGDVFAGRLNYFMAQDLSIVTEWGLGNANGEAISSLDDFRIYTYPMTEREATALHYYEKSNPVSTIGGGSEAPPASGEEAHSITLYPNPSSGHFDIDFLLQNSSEVKMNLIDINGRVILTKAESFPKGPNTLPIDYSRLRLPSGLYIVKLKSEEFAKSIKILVLR